LLVVEQEDLIHQQVVVLVVEVVQEVIVHQVMDQVLFKGQH
tara:strand:+ start:776 stop:898 length:123 start_codon:yes stop_codon:yes gene_type:complete